MEINIYEKIVNIGLDKLKPDYDYKSAKTTNQMSLLIIVLCLFLGVSDLLFVGIDISSIFNYINLIFAFIALLCSKYGKFMYAKISLLFGIFITLLLCRLLLDSRFIVDYAAAFAVFVPCFLFKAREKLQCFFFATGFIVLFFLINWGIIPSLNIIPIPDNFVNASHSIFTFAVLITVVNLYRLEVIHNEEHSVELIKKNKKLKKLEKEKRAFTQILVHELRTITTIIGEATSIVEDGSVGEVTGKQKEMLNMVIKKVDKLNLLASGLLDTYNTESEQIKNH